MTRTGHTVATGDVVCINSARLICEADCTYVLVQFEQWTGDQKQHALYCTHVVSGWVAAGQVRAFACLRGAADGGLF